MLKKISANSELRIVVVSQVIDLISGILLIKLLSNFLTKSDFGYYSLTMSLMALISLLPFTIFDQGAARFVSIYKKDNVFKQNYSNLLSIYVFILLLYSAIMVSLNFIIEDSTWQKILIVLPLWLFFETLKTTLLVIENANRNRKAVAGSKLFDFIFKNSLILFAYLYLGLDIQILILIFTSISLVNVVFFLYWNQGLFQLMDISCGNMKKVFKDIWFFSYPLLVWSIFGWFQNMSNRWLLNAFMNESSVAEFSVVSSLAFVPPNAILGVVASFFIPIIYEKENHLNGYARSMVKKILYIAAGIYTLIVIIAFLYSKEILLVFTDAKYANSAWMMPYMIIATSFSALTAITTYEIYAHNMTSRLILPNIAGGVFSVVFGYYAINYYQMNGALFNFMLTSIITGALVMYITFTYRINKS